MRTTIAILIIAMTTGVCAEALSDSDATYSVLAADLKNKAHFDRFKEQVFHPSALILDSDRDPLDIILRRTRTLLDDIKGMKKAPDLELEEKALATLEQQAASTEIGNTEKRRGLFRDVHALRRDIAFKNPLLNFDELLFIKRSRSRFSHMCDQYYGEHAVPGGGLFVLSNPFSDEPQEENILAESVVESGRLKGSKLDTGGFLSPELSHDGQTV
ncbi:MAG: hypothetical protein HN849_19040, partial [Victivallales bacterium]|nr:hypothetical protein [Victivallales bacterium]